MIKSMSARLGALVTANCIATLSVSGLTLAGFWIAAIVSPGDGGVSSAIGWGFIFGLTAAFYAFAISLPFFLAGLTLVGIPTWWILHRIGRRERASFVVVAAVEAVIAGAVVFRLFAPGSEIVAPLLSISGGLAGWAIWTYGYARLKPPPARPSGQRWPAAFRSRT